MDKFFDAGESSVEEALIEVYLAGVVLDDDRRCCFATSDPAGVGESQLDG